MSVSVLVYVAVMVFVLVWFFVRVIVALATASEDAVAESLIVS